MRLDWHQNTINYIATWAGSTAYDGWNVLQTARTRKQKAILTHVAKIYYFQDKYSQANNLHTVVHSLLEAVFPPSRWHQFLYLRESYFYKSFSPLPHVKPAQAAIDSVVFGITMMTCC